MQLSLWYRWDVHGQENDRFLDILKVLFKFMFSLVLVIITQLIVRPVRVEGLSMYLLNDKTGFPIS